MHLIVNLAEMFCLLYLFALPMSLWVLVLKAVKTFEITEMIWRSDMKLKCGKETSLELLSLCFHEKKLQKNQIQGFNSPIV